MKIIHRVSFTPKIGQLETLREVGVKVEESSSSLVKLVAFDIEESNSAWPIVESLIKKWNMGDVVITKFTMSELKKANSLRMLTNWHDGYPQPDDDFGYLSASFNLTEFCDKCGIGKYQDTPIRLAREPIWGKKHILQVHWLYDEFFVLPDVWKNVFKPLGVGCVPVVHHKTGIELKTVVQLDLDIIADSELQPLNDQPYEICTSCRRKKYLPICRGLFPSFVATPANQIVKTREYFGSGASAWRSIIISSSLFQQITLHKLKGVKFMPCT